MNSRFCKFLVIIVGIVAFSLLALNPSFAEHGDVAKGEEIFNTICQSCHGPGGNPVLPGIPVFAKGERMDKPFAERFKSVCEGKNPAPPTPPMPPMCDSNGGPFTVDQIHDAMAFEETLKK
ncbi:MAG: c-type cytochrome [Thermodesulfobacteriota bacterium]